MRRERRRITGHRPVMLLNVKPRGVFRKTIVIFLTNGQLCQTSRNTDRSLSTYTPGGSLAPLIPRVYMIQQTVHTNPLVCASTYNRTANNAPDNGTVIKLAAPTVLNDERPPFYRVRATGISGFYVRERNPRVLRRYPPFGFILLYEWGDERRHEEYITGSVDYG